MLLEYDVNVKQRDFNLLFRFLKEIIARNATYWINLTHINILCAFLAIFCLFCYVKANFCQTFKITLFFSPKIMITHSEAHFVKKLRHEALPQVQTPWLYLVIINKVKEKKKM